MSGPRNIILIGMPGSGKSTLGVLVAKALGYHFCDTDLVLQTQYGATLAEQMERYGRAEFLEREAAVLSALRVEKTVVATGGSAVYHDASMEHLSRLGLIIWIDVPWTELAERVDSLESRGVVMAPGEDWARLDAKRRPLYQKWAHRTLSIGQEPFAVTLSRLLEVATPAVS